MSLEPDFLGSLIIKGVQVAQGYQGKAPWSSVASLVAVAFIDPRLLV